MSEDDQLDRFQFGDMSILTSRESSSPPKALVDNASLQQAMDKNKESLKVKLMTRRTINQLVEQGILPSLKGTPHFFHQRQKLERAKTGDFLKNKIQRRPDRQELIQQHILEDTTVDPSLHDKQRQLKKARLADDLNDRLSHRPGPLELVKGNILQADEKFAQAVKEGQIQFKRTCEGQSLRHPPSSFIVEEDSGSDVALSPPQDIGDINSVPSVERVSPSPFNSADSPSSETKAFLVSPPSSSPTTFPTSSSSSGGTFQNYVEQHTVPSIRVRKKSKPKSTQPKLRTIKFHEYKGPPSALKSQVAQILDSETSYELLLKQQQLFLQWQLEWQQKYPQMILPVTQKPTIEQTTITNHNNVAKESQDLSPIQKTFSKLEEMKVSELKAELKKRNLPVSGPKPQLIERLKAYLECPINMNTKKSSTNNKSVEVNTVVTSESASLPINLSSIILDKLPTLAPKTVVQEPLTSVMTVDTTTMNLADDGSLLLYNTLPVHGPIVLSRPSSTAPMDVETQSNSCDAFDGVTSMDPMVVNENIVKMQQKRIEELQRELQRSQLQLQQQQWLQQQQQQVQQQVQQHALIATQPVTLSPNCINQLHQIPVSTTTLTQVSNLDAKALQKLQQHLQQKFQQQQLLQQLQQQSNNGNAVFPTGSPAVSAAVKANLAAFIHNQHNANAHATTLTQQPVAQISGIQPIVLCQPAAAGATAAGTFTTSKPRANSVPNGMLQSRLIWTSSLPNFPVVKTKAEPNSTRQSCKVKQENRSQNSGGSGKSRSSKKSVKSQAVDDVLEILIKNGELPPSAAQVPSTPTTPENQKGSANPPSFPVNSIVVQPSPMLPSMTTNNTNDVASSSNMSANSLPSSVLHDGTGGSPLDFDFQLDLIDDIESMDLETISDHQSGIGQHIPTIRIPDPNPTQSNDPSSAKSMDMEFDWLDALPSEVTSQSSSNGYNNDPFLPTLSNGHDNFDMFSLDDAEFKPPSDMSMLNWDKVDYAT